MPTTRVKRIRNRIIGAGGLTEADYIYFSFGDFFEAEHYEDGKTKAELKAFWLKHRLAIIERFLDEKRQSNCAGCRPWAFWKWDMTESRLPVDTTLADNELYDRRKVGCDGLEADYAYLKRLGLLKDWELEVEKKK